jgi:hypothetical protein
MAADSSPGNGFSFDNPAVDGFCYSPEDIAILHSIETGAASMYPVVKEFASAVELREAVRLFAYRNGFEIASGSWKIIHKYTTTISLTLPILCITRKPSASSILCFIRPSWNKVLLVKSQIILSL